MSAYVSCMLINGDVPQSPFFCIYPTLNASDPTLINLKSLPVLGYIGGIIGRYENFFNHKGYTNSFDERNAS